MVLSFYIKESSGNSSSIKFGSMDEEGILPGASLAVYRTKSLNKWSLKGGNISVNKHVPLSGEREFQFKFQLPYLYLPPSDFKYFAEKMSIFNLNLRCNVRDNYCKFKKSCDKVSLSTWYLAFDLSDDAGTSNTYSLPSTNQFLVPGTTFGDTSDTCYLPVFSSQRGDGVWYVGNMILNYLYITFDMTPYDEHGKDYIQVGVAPKNPVNDIGKFYKDTTDDTNDSSQKDDNHTIPHPTPKPTPDKNDTNTTNPDNINNNTHPVDPFKPDPPTPIHVDPNENTSGDDS